MSRHDEAEARDGVPRLPHSGRLERVGHPALRDLAKEVADKLTRRHLRGRGEASK